MSLAVYNSSDVDISRYITGISGLEMRRNFDYTIELPSPTIEVSNLDYNNADELYILLDGIKVFHLYIYDIQYNYENQIYSWKCRDILYKLNNYYPEDFSSDWFSDWSPSSNEWDNPNIYYFDYCISVLYFIKVMIHQVNSGLDENTSFDFSNIENIISPFQQYEPPVRVKKYKELFFWKCQINNFNKSVHFGTTPTIDKGINCLNILNEILKYLKFKLKYYNNKYYLVTDSYSMPDFNIFDKVEKSVNGYNIIDINYGYTTWSSYIPNGFTTGEIIEGGSGDKKNISIINNFEFMARYHQSNEVYPLWGDGYINNLDYLFSKQVLGLLTNYFSQKFVLDIKVPYIYDITPLNNKIIAEKLLSQIKCKNPDYGFPLILPLILR